MHGLGKWFALTACFFVLGLGNAQPGTAFARQVDENYTIHLPAVFAQTRPHWMGPDGGLIAALVIDPQNPQNAYAGSWGGGMYKSTDGGRNWFRSSEGLGNLVINALGIDPQTPSVIYAGTYKGKMYKSVDAGKTWFYSSDGIQDEAIVYSIVVDHQNPNKVYIATRGVTINLDRPWNGVVYKSSDAGASWQVSLANLGGRSYQDWVYALAIHPDNPKVLFAATHEHGPMRSRDGGNTWTILSDGITNYSTRAIGVQPGTSPGVVYTGVWTKDGVFKSIDGGDSWKLKDAGLVGANIYGMSIDPVQPGTVYLATFNMGVMKTTNGGNSWFDAGLDDSPLGVVAVQPGDHNVIFAGSSGEGLYASRDQGRTWLPSQAGLSATNVTALDFDPTDGCVQAGLYGPTGGCVLAGLYGGGMARSLPGGSGWELFNSGLGDKFIHTVLRRPGSRVFYALTHDHGLYRVDLDQSTTWVKTGANLPAMSIESDHAVQTSPDPLAALAGGPLGGLQAGEAGNAPNGSRLLTMQFSAANPQVAYMGTDGGGIYRSTDGGETWSSAGLGGQVVWSLAVDPDDPLHVMAATSQAGGVYSTSDGGANWISLELPGLAIYGLALSNETPAILYAATANGIYRWDVGGWQSAGLQGHVINVIAVDPHNRAVLLAGGTGGAYLSTDFGKTWQDGPLEMHGIAVQTIQFDAVEAGVVYYGTKTHGLYRVNHWPR